MHTQTRTHTHTHTNTHTNTHFIGRKTQAARPNWNQFPESSDRQNIIPSPPHYQSLLVYSTHTRSAHAHTHTQTNAHMNTHTHTQSKCVLLDSLYFQRKQRVKQPMCFLSSGPTRPTPALPLATVVQSEAVFVANDESHMSQPYWSQPWLSHNPSCVCVCVCVALVERARGSVVVLLALTGN